MGMPGIWHQKLQNASAGKTKQNKNPSQQGPWVSHKTNIGFSPHTPSRQHHCAPTMASLGDDELARMDHELSLLQAAHELLWQATTTVAGFRRRQRGGVTRPSTRQTQSNTGTAHKTWP